MISGKFQQAMAFVAEARIELDEAEAECNKLIAAQQEKLAEIRRQKHQLDLIEGKTETTSRRRAAAPAAAAAARAPRGEMQTRILETLRDKPQGLTRGGMIEQMGIKGDKTAEGRLSNALVTMKKNGGVTVDRGRYLNPQQG